MTTMDKELGSKGKQEELHGRNHKLELKQVRRVQSSFEGSHDFHERDEPIKQRARRVGAPRSLSLGPALATAEQRGGTC